MVCYCNFYLGRVFIIEVLFGFCCVLLGYFGFVFVLVMGLW